MDKTKMDVLVSLLQKFEIEASETIGQPVILKPIIQDLEPTKMPQDTLAMIVKSIVSEVLKVTIEFIESPSRERDHVDARYICIKIMQWAMPKYSIKCSLKRTGQYFGNRDHSTILKSYETYSDLYETESAFRKKADACITHLIEYLHIKMPEKKSNNNPELVLS